MSVPPNSRASCAHQWVTAEDPLISLAYKIPVIGWESRQLKPGHHYFCVDCRARLFIKHRGVLHSTMPDSRNFACSYGYVYPSRFASHCICGVRFPEVGYYSGPTGREYALGRMRVHVELCNRYKVFREGNINFHSSSSSRV